MLFFTFSYQNPHCLSVCVSVHSLYSIWFSFPPTRPTLTRSLSTVHQIVCCFCLFSSFLSFRLTSEQSVYQYTCLFSPTTPIRVFSPLPFLPAYNFCFSSQTSPSLRLNQKFLSLTESRVTAATESKPLCVSFSFSVYLQFRAKGGVLCR